MSQITRSLPAFRIFLFLLSPRRPPSSASRVGVSYSVRMHRSCWKHYASQLKGRNTPWASAHGLSSRIALANPHQCARDFTQNHRLYQSTRLNIPSTSLRCPIFRQITHTHPKNTRQISWSFKSASQTTDFHEEALDNEQDVTRAAILDKVMKGRQPTELMLRCASELSCPSCAATYPPI